MPTTKTQLFYGLITRFVVCKISSNVFVFWRRWLALEFIDRLYQATKEFFTIATLSTWKNQTFIISISEMNSFFHFPHLFSRPLISVSSLVVINMERTGSNKKARTEKKSRIMFISSHLRDSNVQGCARRHCRLCWAAQLCLFASFDRFEMIVTDLTIDNCRQKLPTATTVN